MESTYIAFPRCPAATEALMVILAVSILVTGGPYQIRMLITMHITGG
jgi:hypothetical protein